MDQIDLLDQQMTSLNIQNNNLEVSTQKGHPNNPAVFDDCVGENIIHEGFVDPLYLERNTCAYCFSVFQSRNQLFHHLRHMGALEDS